MGARMNKIYQGLKVSKIAFNAINPLFSEEISQLNALNFVLKTISSNSKKLILAYSVNQAAVVVRTTLLSAIHANLV